MLFFFIFNVIFKISILNKIFEKTTCLTALTGATVKSTGARPASAYSIIFANGFNPLATFRETTTKAVAPSFKELALAAVIVP